MLSILVQVRNALLLQLSKSFPRSAPGFMLWSCLGAHKLQRDGGFSQYVKSFSDILSVLSSGKSLSCDRMQIVGRMTRLQNAL